jgi:hypothetical protein
MDPTDLINYQNAIKSIESSGGNYGLTGPATRSGDRAYGAYQVMGNNIPEWTQKHYGQALTPQQFLANKEAQDAVFNGQFGSYVQQHGNPQDAASMWFTGRPLAKGGSSSDGYITGNQYVDKFNKHLGQGGGGVTAINQAMGLIPGSGNQAMAFSGDDGEGGGDGAGAANTKSGTLSFGGNSDGSGKQDNRFGLGDLFGASDETKAKMHGIGARLVRAAAALSAGVNPGQSAQLNALGKSLEEQNKTDYQYTMGPNGQLVKINKDTGEVSFATLPGGGKPNYHVVPYKDADGNPQFKMFDMNTGKPVSGGDTAPATAGPPIGGDPNLTGQERYDSLTSDEKKQMDAWKAGTGIQPSQYSMRQPKTAKLVEAANAIGIDMTKYGERQAFLKGMASKSPTGAGGQFISAPTVMDHLLNVANDYVTLGNSSGGGYSTGAAIANAYKDMRGGTTREAQQTSADRNSDTASKEIVSFLTRGHGGVSERQDTHAKLYMPRAAPEVQAAALEAYRKQVADRFYELYDGAKGSVGEDHPEIVKAEAAFKAKDEALQQKIADLKAGKFPGTAAKPDAATPSAPVIDHDAIDAELKRRGLK